MILTQIILENFGLFSGHNEFDLRPNRKRPGRQTQRPIILFGGKNGSGKTTFLSAMRLLLYGKQSFEGKITQAAYEQALIGHLHRNKKAATRARFARLGVEFEYHLHGEKCVFYVERSWEVAKGDALKESFLVKKNGFEFTDVSSLHWESFIADIIPARLSQLFFFDGEKIKSIAEDLSSNAAIAEAIQSLLGLDHVLSLKSDLKVHRSRVLQKTGKTDQTERINELEKEILAANDQYTTLDEKESELNTKKDGVIASITALEAEIGARGGSFAETRKANQDKANAIEEKIEVTKSQIRSLVDSALPFALAPNIRKKLVKEIEADSASNAGQTARTTVTKLESMMKKEAAKKKPKIEGLDSFISDSISKYLKSLGDKSGSSSHGFGDLRGLEVIRTVTIDADDAVSSLGSALEELDDFEIALREVNRDLERAPSADDLTDVVEKLKAKSSELGSLEKELKYTAEEKTQNRNQKAALERDKEKAEDQLASNAKRTQTLDYISRLGPALDEYKKRLTQAKIESLRDEVTECFNRLARKSDFVHSIDIDPETFGVTLLDHHKRAIPREDLSSGEKQIFAIAMLWGLARTSGKSLPVVIDTPLGRLDSDHRKKLVNEYFPHASHQVILLSTDTEVDQSLYKDLQPNISESYHMVYDHKKGCTSAEAGYYFWNKNLDAPKKGAKAITK